MPERGGLARLRAAAKECRGCELWEPATQVVFSSGRESARVVLVGEAPGDQEDRQGEPFVGPAGRLLDRALEEAGIERADAYLTNAVKHFRFTQAGPGKRRIHQTPDLVHLRACEPWLTAEMALVHPDVVVVMGAVAAKALLGPSFRVTQRRGELIPRSEVRGAQPGPGWFVATVHPSSVLRSDDRETAYKAFVADLRVAASALA